MEACLSSGQCIIAFQLVAFEKSTSVQAFFVGAINGRSTAGQSKDRRTSAFDGAHI
jgi:hypothetical protein